MATWPSTATTTSLASTSRGCRRAREQDRLAHRFAERRHPEVVLELGERLGKRLRDRARAVDRPARHTADLGGDGPRLQQPQRSVVGDRPLDVLRPAEDPRDLDARARRAAGSAARLELGAVVRVELEHLAVGRSSTYREPSTSPLTSGSGPPCTAVTTRRSLRPVTGSMPNMTPPKRRLDQRLHEHRDRAVRRAGTVARREHLLDRGGERVEAADADDRVELAGHRRVRRVLDDRRAARHEVCASPSARSNASRTAGWCVDVRAGVDRVRERGREHDAGQRRETAVRRTGQGGGLAAGQRGVERRSIPKVDHERSHPIVTTPPRAGAPAPGRSTEVGDGSLLGCRRSRRPVIC